MIEGDRSVQMPRKRPSSAEIASVLRRQILSGAMTRHDPLPGERQLAEGHGVSRGTVRQALRQLESEGLVETRRGSGSYVAYSEAVATSGLFASARPLELIDARFALEPHICRLAVLHATRADFDNGERLLGEMEASIGDPEEFSLADVKFHTLLAESTTNPLLIWMVTQINSVRNHEQWAHMRNTTLNPAAIAAYNSQHRRILEAIRAREPEAAAAEMKQHLEFARLSLTRAAAT